MILRIRATKLYYEGYGWYQRCNHVAKPLMMFKDRSSMWKASSYLSGSQVNELLLYNAAYDSKL